MEHYPLKQLLKAVNKVAQELSDETLRPQVTQGLIHVYRRIGADALFHPGLLIAEPNGDDFVDLPDTLIKVIDVKKASPNYYFDRGLAGLVNRSGQIVVGERFSQYEEMENRLYFTEGPLRQAIAITYWQIPVDKDGAPVVDARIYKAAELYCQAEVARVNLHFRNKQSFAATPYQVDIQEARREMDAARGEINELQMPDFIELYKGLHPLGYTQPALGAFGGRNSIYDY